MTPKQQRFVEECRLCDESLKGFYVYGLVDPRDLEVFYIGKGSGARYASHLAKVRNGHRDNVDKAIRILDILSDDQEPIAVCFSDGLTEGEAFSLERTTIREIGLDNLTNATPGFDGRQERARREALHLLRLARPFNQWRAQNNPAPKQISMYHKVLAGLFENAMWGLKPNEIIQTRLV
ncbi:MAG: GIY-YIG nuclease family protein [Geminicoccaceae bacterium]